MDNNQKYACIRRAIIAFFAKKDLDKYGYDVEDFEKVMLFMKSIYIDSVKFRDLCISGKVDKNYEISNDASV